MQHYIVGGCVRDVLMGRTPKDIDHVWTGATPADMIAMGMHQVGAAFPVFLDKEGNEHALARIERKVGVGYNGFDCVFDPSVTIEQDLSRRDLTMNSMAVRAEDWDHFVQTKDDRVLIDPYHGWQWIEKRTIRHTSDAFAEDPIRVLRAARFAARYGFIVATDTGLLMQKVVPELQYVPQERIWVEFEKGLMEPHPYLMMETLKMVGALKADGPLGIYSHCLPAMIFSPLYGEFPEHVDFTTRMVLVLAQDYPDDVYTHHRIPSDIAKVNRAMWTNRETLSRWNEWSFEKRVQFFETVRAFNNIDLFNKVLKVAIQFWGKDRIDLHQINEDLRKSKSIDAAAIAATCKASEIRTKIFDARVRMLSE